MIQNKKEYKEIRNKIMELKDKILEIEKNRPNKLISIEEKKLINEIEKLNKEITDFLKRGGGCKDQP